MSNESSGGTAPSNEALQESLHIILQEWSQLIMSLASLIRENVEGLLPAVFGLAQLVHRASEANVGASSSAREAGATLRDRIAELKRGLTPLTEAANEATQLRQDLAGLREQAAKLQAAHAGDTELQAFLTALIDGPKAALVRSTTLLDAAREVETTGVSALEQLEGGLDAIDRMLHADTSGLEAAAARVKHFVDSSRAAIDQLIVKLQFQDRTDQILSHLLADFESLSKALSEVGDQPFDVDAWQNERKKRFTTAEERNAGAAPSTDAGDIELF